MLSLLPQPDNPLGFTDKDRLTLMNQYAILELLVRAHPGIASYEGSAHNDPAYYIRLQRYVRFGYDYLLKNEIANQVAPRTLSTQDQIDVCDTLEMWEIIQSSYDQLEEKEGLSEQDVTFPGWDSNSDGGELNFVHLYCNGTGERRHSAIRPRPDYDAHMKYYLRYPSMLIRFRELGAKTHLGTVSRLTAQEIKYILAAPF
ncbi:MAG: hypothetical protein HONBIEJF_00600 [Fimbriimonadaceae bacterium]|nr:hypothetical protein [Fimbriimonadaceae bacterium]